MYKIVKIGLIVISVIAFVLLFFMPGKEVPMGEAIKSGGMNAMFILAYLLLGIAVVASVVFGLKNMVSSPGGLKKAGFAVIGLIVLLGISYGLSSGTDIDSSLMLSKNNIVTDESEIKSVGAGINMFGIMLLVAVVLIAWGSIKKATSK